jgi:hypothetical protein
MAYGTVNADLMTTSDGVSSSGLYGFKNRIINGAMVIDQRNAGASITPTNGQFSVDRWQANLTAASKYSIQQSSTTTTGFSKSLLVTSLSAYSVGSGDQFNILQKIEGFNIADLGFGAAGASPITLSFWVRSSLTGTFSGSINNGAFTRNYIFNYTVSSANTWTQISVTVAGDTSGSWTTDNSAGLNIVFGLGSGSTYSGTAGSWGSTYYTQSTGSVSVVGTNGATFYITGVQLEKGSTATSFDYRPYGTELALCQRYYEIYSNGTGTSAIYEGLGGYFANTTTFRTAVPFKITKRASPSVSVPTTYLTVNCSTGNLTPSSAGSNFSSPDGATINCNTSAVTSGQGGTLGISSSAPITISAEL